MFKTKIDIFFLGKQTKQKRKKYQFQRKNVFFKNTKSFRN